MARIDTMSFDDLMEFEDSHSICFGIQAPLPAEPASKNGCIPEESAQIEEIHNGGAQHHAGTPDSHKVSGKKLGKALAKSH